MSPELMAVIKEISTKVAALPVHTSEEIEAAAHHLEMLHYQKLIDFTQKDFIRLTNGDFHAELERVANLTPRELGVTATVIEDWTDGPSSAEKNRKLRLEFMFRRYKKLCGLRSNEPESWDEINELYYDD